MRGMLADAVADRPVPPPLGLRLLEPGDSSGLGALMAAAYRGTIDDPRESDAWFQRDAEATLQGEYGAVSWAGSTVAVDGHELVGTCLVTDDDPCMLLAFALVIPRWQAHGLGSALIARSAAHLLDEGYAEWALAVTDGNRAIGLYERLGFHVDLSLRRERDRNGS
jgi:GNAT superfamily N-acetyltransferase